MRSDPFSTSIQPSRARVFNRIELVGLAALPLLGLAMVEMRAAEAGVAARIRWAAEADLVPRPRMRVEARARLAADERERARHVERRPDASVELPVGEAVHELVLLSIPEQCERRGAELLRLLVEPARDALPRFAVVGHVEIAVAVELSLVELLVDEREHRDLRLLSDLSQQVVDERLERRRLSIIEEADRRHVANAVEHDLARHLVPMVGLLVHVVVGIATDHSRCDAPPLLRQVRRLELPAHFSLRTSAATMPNAPTIVSDPGARSGGPMTRLYVGSEKPPGFLRTPCTCVTIPITPSSAYSAPK